MVRPVEGRSGSSGSRITVKALDENDPPLIDGQGQDKPLRFCNNSWWVVQGMNFRNGVTQSASLAGACSSNPDFVGPGSDDNVFRRLVIWDGNGTENTAIVEHSGFSDRNLWEDVAVFGMGRNSFEVYNGQDNKCRRCWIRMEGNMSTSGPVHGFQPAYGGTATQAHTVCETCLFTWWAGSMPESYIDGYNGSPHNNYEVAGQITGPMFSESNCDEDQQIKMYGNLSYIRAGDSISYESNPNQMFSFRRSDNIIVRDVLAIVPAGFTGASGVSGFVLGDACGSGNTATRITSALSGGGNNINTGAWTVTQHATSLSASPWGDNGGANLCYEYEDGVRQDGTGGTTVKPMWPWRMDARIVAAMAQAGSYSNACIACSGGRFTRAGTANPTADVEALLGPIPASCRR